MYVVHHDFSFCSNSVAVGNIYPRLAGPFLLPVTARNNSLNAHWSAQFLSTVACNAENKVYLRACHAVT